MADLILLSIRDDLRSSTCLLYDGACGTGGMLTIAEEHLKALARQHDIEVATRREVLAIVTDLVLPEYRRASARCWVAV